MYKNIFDSNNKFYNILKSHFDGIELCLRSAILLNYANYLYKQDKKDVEKLLKDIKKNNNAKYIKKLTEIFEYDEILMKWYKHYSPDKATKEHIDNILKRYILAENVLFNRLYIKYVDENHDQYAKLWFAKCERPIAKNIEKPPKKQIQDKIVDIIAIDLAKHLTNDINVESHILEEIIREYFEK